MKISHIGQQLVKLLQKFGTTLFWNTAYTVCVIYGCLVDPIFFCLCHQLLFCMYSAWLHYLLFSQCCHSLICLFLIWDCHFYRAVWNADAVTVLQWEFCPSVRLSNACIVTIPKKNLSRFLYHAKDHLVQFSEKKNGWWGRPLLPEILGQPAPVGAKSPIFSQ